MNSQTCKSIVGRTTDVRGLPRSPAVTPRCGGSVDADEAWFYQSSLIAAIFCIFPSLFLHVSVSPVRRWLSSNLPPSHRTLSKYMPPPLQGAESLTSRELISLLICLNKLTVAHLLLCICQSAAPVIILRFTARQQRRWLFPQHDGVFVHHIICCA